MKELPRPWGCPKCGCTESMVDDTGYDEEGYVVRNRRCQQCRTMWATEELPIRMGFWTRAHSRNEARRALARKRRHRCAKCGGRYTYGKYNMHVRLSPVHQAAVKPPANGSDRRKVLDYQREWARRKRAA